MTFEALYEAARAVLNPRKLSNSADAGGVAAALLTDSGRVYTGVCVETNCSMGFCAEHAAAAAMITAGENRVVKMVAVGWNAQIMSPCGRCREFISQLHNDNRLTEVLVAENKVVTLADLLPFD
jgi:cytidine deaminase